MTPRTRRITPVCWVHDDPREGCSDCEAEQASVVGALPPPEAAPQQLAQVINDLELLFCGKIGNTVEKSRGEALRRYVAKLLAAPPEAAPLEICICAAVQFADGRIVRGHRHDGCLKYAADWTPKPELTGHVQGFVTSRNRFVNREEGAALQNAAGIDSAQTRKPVNGQLFSEDLYFDSHDHVAWSTPYREAPPEAGDATKYHNSQ